MSPAGKIYDAYVSMPGFEKTLPFLVRVLSFFQRLTEAVSRGIQRVTTKPEVENHLLCQTLLSRHGLRVADFSEIWTPPPPRRCDECLVIANGPSFRDIKEACLAYRSKVDVYTLNSAPLTDWFWEFKPLYHMMYDDAHFIPENNWSDPAFRKEVSALFQAFTRVDWPLQLAVPYEFVAIVKEKLSGPHLYITGASYFEMPEGHPDPMRALAQGHYIIGTANSVVRNLCMAILAGYKKIWLAGADASFLGAYYTDQFCRLYRDVPHSYDSPVRCPDYLSLGGRMSMNLDYMRQISYVKKIAEERKIPIINLSLPSLLDMFPKGEIGREPYAWKPDIPAEHRGY